ncbi:hypothetical protein [Geobacillus sp. JS12]|uniref:hypothetical protein n=1 Tax=Geobacillus sp. JS12 TaxID=1813182 RepID=UPI001F2088EC|nr:hypothetical protein [Geobacillus sp. JS12]
MAGVQTTLALNDKLTGPLMKMIRAMDATIRVMEKMDASATQLDTKGLAKARKAITNASADLERLVLASKQSADALTPLQSKFSSLPPLFIKQLAPSEDSLVLLLVRRQLIWHWRRSNKERKHL